MNRSATCYVSTSVALSGRDCLGVFLGSMGATSSRNSARAEEVGQDGSNLDHDHHDDPASKRQRQTNRRRRECHRPTRGATSAMGG